MEDKESWNKFIIENSSPASFLQSYEWGDFQETLGNKVYRLKAGQVVQAQAILKKLYLGRKYLEIPKGPIISDEVIKNEGEFILLSLVAQLRRISKQDHVVLARVNPPYSNFEFEGLGFRKPEILLRQTEPEDTTLVDLSKSEDELLQNMHEKSRYNIRLAQKKGVKVRIATDERAAFETFLELLEETTKRDSITSWPEERFWKFWEKFMDVPSPDEGRVAEGREGFSPHAELLIGEYQGKILAAAIIMLFGNAGTYLYAASSAENRSANAPSLVLWEAIKLAKARGKRWYDMWGIAPAAAGESHPWDGITRFKSRYVKLGVTGKEMRNIGALDLVLDRKFYSLFKLGKKIFR